MITLKEKFNQFSEAEQEEILARASEMKNELRILRAVRELAGVSQGELAEMLNVGQPYISRLENRENVTIKSLAEVAKVLGCSLNISFEFTEKNEIINFAQIENYLASKSKKLGAKEL